MSWRNILKEIWKPKAFRELEKEGRLHADSVSIGGIGFSAVKSIKPAYQFAGKYAPKVASQIGKLTKYLVVGKTLPTTAIKTASVIGGIGIISTAPKQVLKMGKTATKKVYKTGQRGGELLLSDTKEEDKPKSVISGLKTAGIIGGVMGGAYAYNKLKEEKETLSILPFTEDKPKKQKEDAPLITPQVPMENPKPEKQLTKEKPVGIPETPILPETTPITTKKRRYKRRVAKKPTNIRQSVRIAINNRTTGLRVTNKRYLNEDIFF